MLAEYKRKRNFKKTAEPAGNTEIRLTPGERSSPDRVFIVQKHAARRLHYDFRLELDGVLLSWAVPAGPSSDPAQKRLAVHVEDHPYDYKDFEGVIAPGEYGAGQVIVWDQGTYTPLVDGQVPGSRRDQDAAIRTGLRQGKLTVYLDGKKMRGEWALVRLKTPGQKNNKDNKEWLLVKANDEFADRKKDITSQDESVKSGLRVEEITPNKSNSGKQGGAKKKQRTAKSKSAADHFPSKIEPMLASLARAPFDRPGWFFEPKLDGYRVLAYVQDHEVRLLSRRGLSLTSRFQLIARDLARSKNDVIFDGEVVALDEKGQPSFQHLQQMHSAREPSSYQYYVFDILYADGKDLRKRPLQERKTILRKTLRRTRHVRLLDFLACDGETAYQACIEQGMEGIVAKRADSRYEDGHRAASWLKVKATASAEFVICGYTQGDGSRQETFGALVLGQKKGRGLHYTGLVGTGFSTAQQKHLLSVLKPLARAKNPFAQKIPGLSRITWVQPQVVAEVKYAEVTRDGLLRAPVFLRLRQDKGSQETGPEPTFAVKSRARKSAEMENTLSNSRKSDLQLHVGRHEIAMSNLDKVLWPASQDTAAITKRDYALYLERMAPYLLTHMSQRPLTLIRYPDGIGGKRFFQKHWSNKVPPFVDLVEHYSEHDDSDKEFLLSNNPATLMWLAQMAAVELHIEHTRVDRRIDGHRLPVDAAGSLAKIEHSVFNYPDFIVLDLDPYLYAPGQSHQVEPQLHKKGFARTCQVAFWLKELLDEIGLASFVKTSGKTGLHVYVPIKRKLAYDNVRAVAAAFGHHLRQAHQDTITMEWAVKKRSGKVFFDHNMNARGKTLPCPYSPRAAEGGAVSTPITWEELASGSVYPSDFTIATVPDRVAKLGDPWSEILKHKSDLQALIAGKDTRALLAS